MQVKLLRAVQEKSVRPVGSSTEVPVDVRIISATHRDLSKEVSNGNFRQDLYYRINVIQLIVPPLRERAADIPKLADHFITSIAKQWGVTKPAMSKEALNALREYSFPGNVRELENTLERAIALCESDTIAFEHLQLPERGTGGITANDDNVLLRDDMPLEDQLTDIEKQAILQALEETRRNKTAAAKKLGMSFRSLRYRLKKLGLDEEQER
jgi:two-component system response regulator PilR (NtrC family)